VPQVPQVPPQGPPQESNNATNYSNSLKLPLRMSVTEYPEINFAEIKRWLEREDRRTLCKEFNLTAKYISYILSGRRRNMAVVNRASELAAQRKAKVVSGMNRLKQIDA